MKNNKHTIKKDVRNIPPDEDLPASAEEEKILQNKIEKFITEHSEKINTYCYQHLYPRTNLLNVVEAIKAALCTKKNVKYLPDFLEIEMESQCRQENRKNCRTVWEYVHELRADEAYTIKKTRLKSEMFPSLMNKRKENERQRKIIHMWMENYAYPDIAEECEINVQQVRATIGKHQKNFQSE